MGGLQLVIDETHPASHPVHTWTYNTSAGGPGGTFTFEQVMYPAELCYFGNSPLRVSDTPHLTTDYPDGSGTTAGEWMNDASWTADWSIIGKHVLSTTRSVAMAHNINYGTALLKSTIKYGAASRTTTPPSSSSATALPKRTTPSTSKQAVCSNL